MHIFQRSSASRLISCTLHGMRRVALGIALVSSLLAPTSTRAQSADGAGIDAAFWKTFHHGTVSVNGIRLHYVEGGSGAPMLLIPGWPESWYAWRRVMPALAASGRHVVVIDPPGMGDSSHPQSGYDMKSVAADVHGFVEALGLTKDGPVDVAAHDVGVWIGYAYASDWPGDVKRIALFEAAVPGVTPPAPAGFPDDATNLKTWHFAFNRLDDLPEILVQGHEREYLTWIFQNKAVKTWAIGPADIDEYVRVFKLPGAVRASFAYYQAAFNSEGLAQSRARAQHKLPMPVLAIGGEYSIGNNLVNLMRTVATDVSGGTAAGCGHFILEECPDAVIDDLKGFAK